MITNWPAPAKLNLCLHVLGCREDGYHELQTLYQFLSVADVISLQVRADGRIRRVHGCESTVPEQDLALRAAELLRKSVPGRLGVDIGVHKRLPVGGGLGGGSSDAATVLVALNHLWQCGLSIERLSELGLCLGADVPVFVAGRAAWGEGVGERLTPVRLPEPWFLVIRPPCAVSTAEVFSAPELTRNSSPITIADFLSGRGRNDCEPVVRARYPAVARALDWLGQHGRAQLTGTGSCVFAAFGSEAEAKAVCRCLPSDVQGFIARGCNRSPLHETLARAGRRR